MAMCILIIKKIQLIGPSALRVLDLLAYQPEFQIDIPNLNKESNRAQFWIAGGSLGKYSFMT
jgi:hypothetical protein